jgi:NADPH:quinone reductase
VEAAGLNFADVYRRQGRYHLEGSPPYVLGYEGAGTIEEVGAPNEAGAPPPIFERGDRVGFADVPRANAELVVAPWEKLIPLPEAISAELAAASLLQGLTAQYLARDSHRVGPGETVLVHAAAGGVGLLLVQLCRSLGARVLGVVGSEEKELAARAAGCEATVRSAEDWVGGAQAFSGGAGVDVVYDSVGVTLPDSLRASRRGGQVVFFGMAGGDPPKLDPRELMDGSRTLTGGDLWNVLTSSAERLRRAGELFEWLAAGKLQLRIAARHPLAEGARAHAALESRGTIGKILLIP